MGGRAAFFVPLPHRESVCFALVMLGRAAQSNLTLALVLLSMRVESPFGEHVLEIDVHHISDRRVLRGEPESQRNDAVAGGNHSTVCYSK